MVSALWIAFDALICVRMMFKMGPFTLLECIAWGLGGLVLAGVAWWTEHCERVAHTREVHALHETLDRVLSRLPAPPEVPTSGAGVPVLTGAIPQVFIPDMPLGAQARKWLAELDSWIAAKRAELRAAEGDLYQATDEHLRAYLTRNRQIQRLTAFRRHGDIVREYLPYFTPRIRYVLHEAHQRYGKNTLDLSKLNDDPASLAEIELIAERLRLLAQALPT